MPLTYITSIFFATTSQQVEPVEPEVNGKLEDDWQMVSDGGDVMAGGDTGVLPDMDQGYVMDPKDGVVDDAAGKAGTRSGLSFAAIAKETIQCQAPPQETQPGLGLANKTVANAAPAKNKPAHVTSTSKKGEVMEVVAMAGPGLGHLRVRTSPFPYPCRIIHVLHLFITRDHTHVMPQSEVVLSYTMMRPCVFHAMTFVDHRGDVRPTYVLILNRQPTVPLQETAPATLPKDMQARTLTGAKPEVSNVYEMFGDAATLICVA